MLHWEARAATAGDPRLWAIERGEPDAHPLFANQPGRHFHRVRLMDLEAHWQLDGAIVGSGLAMFDVVRDDGDGGHVWFEEIPGWAEPEPPTLAQQLVTAASKRSHHKRRG